MKRKIMILSIMCILCFLLLPSCASASSSFADVKDGDWYYDGVTYVSENGMMNGVGNNKFDPKGNVTRGMLVTVIYRMEKEPNPTETCSFADVDPGSYYENAVAWAAENGIVNGTSQTKFSPNDNVTREQFATILYRYSEKKGYDTTLQVSLSEYSDASAISTYALTAMQWAVGNQLINGIKADTLAPKGESTRAQMATIMLRFDKMMSTEDSKEQKTTEINTGDTSADDSAGATSVSTKSDVFTVQFIDWDGTVLSEQFIASGSDAVPPTILGREGYSFTGWDEAYTNVRSNLRVTAQYTARSQTSTSPLLTVESVSCKAGSSAVTVDISLKNNPGILGATLAVNFDETYLTLTKAENGEAVKDVLNLTKSSTLKSGCKFVWDGVEILPENCGDGVMLRLTFAVSDSAPKGSYPVSVSYYNGDIVDNDLKAIEVDVWNGEIQVK